ncbi:hypothetical protein MAR_007521 [Mya arenaria]|uniref:Globin domain-containing protein n=1 Tax=Mya arenaria TaxID=6604 RepID=A0ABY7DFC3_MYAAR|nr:hypothetical protein MAR_007521 [Mya arenaria]
MFENRPELIEIFANFRGRDIGDLQRSGLIRQHALMVMGTIDKCISRIDEPENLAKLLIETGALHRKYNVPPDVIQGYIKFNLENSIQYKKATGFMEFDAN